MPQDSNSTDESPDSVEDSWGGLGRRPLLKTLGAGAALSLGTGFGVAAQEQAGNGDGESAEIDPLYGYPTADAEAIPESLSPDHEVEMRIAQPAGPGQPPLFYFDPVGLRVEPGDVVQFTSQSPDHTVTAYHPGIGFPMRRVPEAAGPFSSPVLGPGGAWLFRFEPAGLYDVYCAPHQLFGMVMRLVVGDLADDEMPAYGTSVEGLPNEQVLSQGLNNLSDQNEDAVWPFVTPAEVLGADPLRPANVRDAGEVPFSAVADALGYEFQPPPATPSGTETPSETATPGGNATSGNATSENG